MPDTTPNAFGKVLLDLLDERGCSQAELARRARYSEAYISKLARGRKTDCTVGCLYRLATALGGAEAFGALTMGMHQDMCDRSAQARPEAS